MKQIEKPIVGQKYFVEAELSQIDDTSCPYKIKIGYNSAWLDVDAKFYIDSPPILSATINASAGSGYSGGPIVAASGSGGTATPGGSHNPVTGRPYKFDRKNWCVDISDERNRELLPAFKEWLNKIETENKRSVYGFISKYYGLCHGCSQCYGDITTQKIITLSELKTHMPEVFGVKEPEWRPKEGQRVFINRLNQEATIREIKTIYYLECHEGYFRLAELNPVDSLSSKIRNIAPELNDQQVEGLVKLLEGC